MANYFPVALVNGTMEVMDSTTVVNPAFFPVSRSVQATSNSFATRLPDPYYFQTQSANVTVATNGVSSSLSVFTVPTRLEKQYYMSEGILEVASANAALAGPKISIDRANLGDGSFRIAGATSLSAISVFYQGSKDSKATASLATTIANNTAAPVLINGLFFNSTSQSSFTNTVYIETSASVSVTGRSGSVTYQHFLGLSSSLTPFSSSRAPLTLISGTLDGITGGDLITQSVLPATRSLWVTSSLLTRQVSSSVAGAWQTVFTLTGMQDGKKYLVNHYLKMVSSATGTAVWVRVVSGSNFNGFLLACGSSGNANITDNTAASSGSSAIVNTLTSGLVSTNVVGRLFLGEYTLVKAAGQNPTIDIVTEVNASTIYANSGSFVMWRLLE